MTTTTPAAKLSAAAAIPPSDAFCCSGSSPTIHVLGGGKVGQALLRQLAATRLRTVAVTDSSATVHDAAGLDTRRVADHKAAGGRLADWRGAEPISTALAADLIDADIVVDATPTDLAGADRALRRCHRVLGRGGRLVLAAKDALCSGVVELLAVGRERIGLNAVLGGTGLRLRLELDALRRQARSFAAVPNASTTALVLAIEAGASPQQAVESARARGLLEADPALDLDGTDAATKLAIVVGALWGTAVRPAELERPHALQLDPEVLRARARRGGTTRLVVRAAANGRLGVAYEELDRRAPLAVPADRVAYCYGLSDGLQRVHTGAGLGPQGTAAALLEDLLAFAVPGGAS